MQYTFFYAKCLSLIKTLRKFLGKVVQLLFLETTPMLQDLCTKIGLLITFDDNDSLRLEIFVACSIFPNECKF